MFCQLFIITSYTSDVTQKQKQNEIFYKAVIGCVSKETQRKAQQSIMGKRTRSTKGSNLKTAASGNSVAAGGDAKTTTKKRKAATAKGKAKSNSNNNNENNNNIMELPKFDPSAYKLDSDDSDDEELFQPSVFARKSIDSSKQEDPVGGEKNNNTNLQQSPTAAAVATTSSSKEDNPENGSEAGDANNPEEIEKKGKDNDTFLQTMLLYKFHLVFLLYFYSPPPSL